VPPVGVLFLFLAACFAGLAIAAAPHKWVIAVAAGAVAVWFGDAAIRMLRRRR